MFKLPVVCRFCTRSSNLNYNLGDENSSLIGKLATLAPDTVELSDTLPQRVCQSCHDKLNETYRFQQQIYHVFKLCKTFVEHQQTLIGYEGEETKSVSFQYPDEGYISNELRQFLNRVGGSSAPKLNKTFTKSDVKTEARKPEATVVKRKRGRPRKYCGLVEFKNDDLTDVEKMKVAVVNSLPKIDPDYERAHFSEDQPLVINLRKKRGRPKSVHKQEKENKVRNNNEALVVAAEEGHQVAEKPVKPVKLEKLEKLEKPEKPDKPDKEPNEPGCSNQDANVAAKGSSEASYWRKAI